MTAAQPINVYLLPTYQFQTSPDGCALTVTPSLFQANFTAYTLHWVAPVDEAFHIILTGPTTIIMLTDRGSSQPVKEFAYITYAASTQTNFQPCLSTGTTAYTIRSNSHSN